VLIFIFFVFLKQSNKWY